MDDKEDNKKMMLMMISDMKKIARELQEIMDRADPQDLHWMMEVCRAAKFWRNLYNMVMDGVFKIVLSHTKGEVADVDEIMKKLEKDNLKKQFQKDLGLAQEPAILHCDGKEMPEIICPCCHTTQKAAVAGTDEATRQGRPHPGCPSVCGKCGSLLIFNDDLTVREPELNDLMEIPADLMAKLEDWQRKIKKQGFGN